MTKKFKNLSKFAAAGLLAFALVLTAGSAQAALTFGATAVTTDGALTIDGVAASVYTLGASTTTGTITIGGSAQTGAINIGNASSTAVTTINIGTNTQANVVTIGSTTGAATLNLKAGSGGVVVTGVLTATSPVFTTPALGAATATSVAIGGGTVITGVVVYTPTLTPAATAAAVGTTQQTFTVTGLATTDKLIVNGPVPTSLCPMTGYRASAVDTLQLDFTTLTAAACTPPTGVYKIVAIRS